MPRSERLARLVSAWNQPGPRPDIHRAAKNRLRREWPALFLAVDAVVRDEIGPGGRQSTDAGKEALIENLESQINRGIIDHYTATSIRELIGYVRSGT